MNQPSFAPITLKTAAVHTVTYFIIGVLSFLFLGYTTKYADPTVANFVRQTEHPLVTAGPFFKSFADFFSASFFTLCARVSFHTNAVG
jgi:hypothetical protein